MISNTKLIRNLSALTLVAVFFSSCSSFEVNKVEKCKVIDLQQQQLISGTKDNMSTEIRYLVITDKETFICESSLVNGKFDNSDIFFRLKKDSVYSFKVEGYKKSFVYDYRNILEIVK